LVVLEGLEVGAGQRPAHPQRKCVGGPAAQVPQAGVPPPRRPGYRWYRSDWRDIQRHKDGINIDPSGQSELIRAVSKLIPTTQQQSNDGWLSGTRDSQLPTARPLSGR
jgi:hypothetical protein